MKISLICPGCGVAFYRRKSNITGKTVCCSYACSHVVSPRQKPRSLIPIVCEGCGETFLRKKSNIRGNTVCCSYKCSHMVARRQKTSAATVNAVCKHCGDSFSKPLARASKNLSYCSRKCQTAALLAARWAGHQVVSKRPHAVRLAIADCVSKVGQCERCGQTQDLHGHHIVPISKRPDLGADPTNIEVLCRECHAKEHPDLKIIAIPRPKTGYSISCEECGTERYVFPSLKGVAKYCGNKCRMKALSAASIRAKLAKRQS